MRFAILAPLYWAVLPMAIVAVPPSNGVSAQLNQDEAMVVAEELAAAKKALEDYDKLQRSLGEKLRAASSAAQRDAVERSLSEADSDFQRRRRQVARRLLELVRRIPADPAAVDALVWVAWLGPTTESATAMDVLMRDHLDSAKIGWGVCRSLAYADRESDLRHLMARSPHKVVRGFACYELAGYLKRQGDANPSDRERQDTEMEALFKQVADDYADVEHPSLKYTLGELAANVLFERRNLAVGKLAPEIDGEDMAGRRLRLSDFRGKVVLLDFWGFG